MTPSFPRLDLRQITLCAVDCLNPALAVRALKLSAKHCDFADVVLLSDQIVDTSVSTVLIDPIRSTQQYSEFMIRELNRHVHTPWALVVQWDGYVVHPDAWRHDFLDYDYIGAHWPWHGNGTNVGNGGFSLRSKRLLEVLSKVEWSEGAQFAEDDLICRTLRPTLEQQYGIRFAPQAIAERFAYEHVLPNAPTFGFHGTGNMWRHISDDELAALISQMDRKTFMSKEMLRLLWSYYSARKFDIMRVVYTRLKEVRDRDQLLENLIKLGAPVDRSAHCINVSESLL